jgi:hypothetical protein
MRHPVLADCLYNGPEIEKTQRFHDVTICTATIAFCDISGGFGIAKDDNGRERQRVFILKRPYLTKHGETVCSRQGQVQQD